MTIVMAIAIATLGILNLSIFLLIIDQIILNNLQL